MIYNDLLTLRIKVELTEGENDHWLFLTIKVSFSVMSDNQSNKLINVYIAHRRHV